MSNYASDIRVGHHVSLGGRIGKIIKFGECPYAWTDDSRHAYVVAPENKWTDWVSINTLSIPRKYAIIRMYRNMLENVDDNVLDNIIRDNTANPNMTEAAAALRKFRHGLRYDMPAIDDSDNRNCREQWDEQYNALGWNSEENF